MDIVSYDEVEVNSPVEKYLSKLSNVNIFDQKQYRKYTGGYDFPSKLKSKLI